MIFIIFALFALLALICTACAFERHPHIYIPEDYSGDDFVKSKSLSRQDAPTREPSTMTHISVKNYPLGDRVPEYYVSIGFIQVPLSEASDLACLKQNPISFGNLDDPSNYRGDIFMTEPSSSICAFIGVRSSGNYCIYIPVKQMPSFVEKLNGNINYQAETLALQIQQLSDKVEAFSNSTSILVEKTSDSTLLYAVIGIQFCGMALACVCIWYMKTHTNVEAVKMVEPKNCGLNNDNNV
jgi:hypothetical protein